MKNKIIISVFAVGLLCFSYTLKANEVDVLKARAKCNKKDLCTFTVRVKHKDAGWHHYVNRWEVLSLDGEVLATRELAHPHVDEQPFSRTLFKAPISSEHKSVVIRGHDSVHGYGGEEIIVDLRK